MDWGHYKVLENVLSAHRNVASDIITIFEWLGNAVNSIRLRGKAGVTRDQSHIARDRLELLIVLLGLFLKLLSFLLSLVSIHNLNSKPFEKAISK